MTNFLSNRKTQTHSRCYPWRGILAKIPALSILTPAKKVTEVFPSPPFPRKLFCNELGIGAGVGRPLVLNQRPYLFRKGSRIHELSAFSEVADSGDVRARRHQRVHRAIGVGHRRRTRAADDRFSVP